ncbi:MAG: hypothetical protein FJ109_09735 [Deltaproteobacteria bacterium]|nr:hypothetical protein [Deltaproteobacteria bacterium]
MKLSRAVGQEGTVYLNIPAGGTGEVRVLVGGVMNVLKARTADGKALSAGTAVKVIRVISAGLLEVVRSE